MKCSMIISKLRKDAPYYSVADYDERIGGKFTMLIVPFRGNDNERFYYVKELDNHKIEIEGEGYIITDDDSLKRHKRETRTDLGKDSVWYYWLDENGNVISKDFC